MDDAGEGGGRLTTMSVRTSCDGATSDCGVRRVEYGHVVNGVVGRETDEDGLRGKANSSLTETSAEESREPKSYSLCSSGSVFIEYRGLCGRDTDEVW